MGKLIAFIGPPGSGKTSVAMQTAIEVYLGSKSNKVVFLSPDLAVPSLGLLFPNYSPDDLKSLGRLFDRTDINEVTLLENAVALQSMNDLLCFGYKTDDSKDKYPEPLPEKLTDLFSVLDRKVAYTVVDCSDDPSDVISDYAIRKLSACGVTVLFENDNIDTKTMNSELILYVKGAFAQSEALAGSKRVSTAFRMKMENGTFVTTNAPFGYTIDEKGVLKIVPEQAEVVKRIFDLYLSGNGIERITEMLNMDCISGNHGRWNAPAVRYILMNEKYIGDSLWQKTYTPQAFPLRNVPNKGEVDKYYVTGTHAPIISRGAFEAVQLRLHRDNTCRKSKKGRCIFDKMLFCESCGWGYKRKVLHGVTYWVCSRKSEAGHICAGKNVREDEIKEAFVMMYNKLRFFEKEVLDKTLAQLLGVREKISGQNNEIAQIDAEIAKLCDTNNMYTQLHGQGIIDEVSFLERTSELKYKITELRRRRLKLLAADEEERLIENLRVLKETLNESPKVILAFDRQLFQDITEKVLIGNNDTVVFQLKGGLQFRQPIKKKIKKLS